MQQSKQLAMGFYWLAMILSEIFSILNRKN